MTGYEKVWRLLSSLFNHVRSAPKKKKKKTFEGVWTIEFWFSNFALGMTQWICTSLQTTTTTTTKKKALLIALWQCQSKVNYYSKSLSYPRNKCLIIHPFNVYNACPCWGRGWAVFGWKVAYTLEEKRANCSFLYFITSYWVTFFFFLHFAFHK